MRSKCGHFSSENAWQLQPNRYRKKKNHLLESEQACGHHLQVFNAGGLTLKPSKIAAYSFDR